MSKNLVRLRQQSAERGDTVTPAGRDNLMGTFLDELSTVVCEEVVDNLADSVLNLLYLNWIKDLMADGSEDDRRTRIISSVMVFPQAKPAEKPEQPLNVRSLFG